MKLPATIGFGEVRHTRLRPRRHAFSYPSYFLRLPVTDLQASLAGLRWCSHNRWNLLSFYDADHNGGQDRLAPLTWVRQLLAAEGVADADGEVWLHAFPRVLGYVFNPVSFWFCHRLDGSLRAVVCVVSNTFGERHCYLLCHADGRAIGAGESLQARKVFHVSPFCAVEGDYRFRFMQARGRSIARIDYHDEAGPLLLTSISGTHVPLTNASTWSALWRFPLFTFGVVARIHWQAVRLWMRRVPFFSKPAPPVHPVSR